MLTLFIKGLVFGAGVFVAMTCLTLLLPYVLPLQAVSIDDLIESIPEPKEGWGELPKEQQIRQATALLVVRYSVAEDGEMLATVSQVHVDNPGIDVGIAVGDPIPTMNFYPRPNYSVQDGAVRFFTGNPPKDVGTYYLYNDTVSAYGNMPLDLLIRKFQDDA